MTRGRRVAFVVGCPRSGTTLVQALESAPAKAKDLYTSDWFRKARAYVEHRGGPWFILSAEHGLVDPETVIGPSSAGACSNRSLTAPL